MFCGGAGTVTGSEHLVTAGGRRVLLDCGLFQGLRELRRRNWNPPPFDPQSIEAVVLSHAHVDHCGYLPLLVRLGFRGRVFCTAGTADLLRVVLTDSAKLQEEEAEEANLGGYSKHHPALPLYTVRDAEFALQHLAPKPYGQPIPVADGISAQFRRAGHILGAATIELHLEGRPSRTIVFSGDLGRWDQPILRDPEPVTAADVLLLESTYGDRVHPPHPMDGLARVVNAAVARKGVLLVPAFAVGRTQLLIWMLRELERAETIPSGIPVFVDSPMAKEVSAMYERHAEDHDAQMREVLRAEHGLHTEKSTMIATAESSRALNQMTEFGIIIAASGMATGGRIVHHLKARLPYPETTVLLVGFQAEGTRGRALQDGAPTVRIHGQDVPVRAAIETLDGLSAHADREELLRWLQGFTAPPKQTYLVHGESVQAASLAELIASRLRWPVVIAQAGQTVPLA